MNLYEEFSTIKNNNPKLFNYIIDEAKDFAVVHGNILRLSNSKDSSDIVQHAPITLLPSPFPKNLYIQALKVQPIMNKLYFKISLDYEFLKSSLKCVIDTDDFTKKLFNIYDIVMKESLKQPITLLLQRSDYFCHVNTSNPNKIVYELKQIEVNNIAAGMASLSQITTQMHKHILRNFSNIYNEDNHPSNRGNDTVGKGLAEAWKMYGNTNAYVLQLVEDTNKNQLDHRHIQYATDYFTSYKCKTIRIPLSECRNRLKLGKNYELIMDDIYEIGVVYFRTGYSPENYIDEEDWNSRLLIEKSCAIKSPWIGLQLANTKRIQQVLIENGVVEKFLNDIEEIKDVKKTFAMMWSLNDNMDEIKKKVINNCKDYVLKEQLEGGAGNYFDDDIIEKMNDVEKLKSCILMERLNPMKSKNYIMVSGKEYEESEVVSELGIMGTYLGNITTNQEYFNYSGGYLLRTKKSNETKGGVTIGASSIDSIYLI
ncbi:Glutathione synthetase [Strongyloides ratti]|uniref:Glutathione synthetase n=1 Tax=Strongyloides ratti TaxID=34506 RepID=A0A090MZX5_STRRB|nr:Glutathione synthetase [Strongyloides ratti]CEF69695.1 Glutathione synthetase [Strongyloides ratti]